MKKFKTKHNDTEEYWKSFTDIMAALLLIIVLIMALLFIYLTQLQSNDNYDGNGNHHWATVDSHTPTQSHYPTMPTNPTYPTERREDGGGHGETRVTEPPTEPPTEGGEDIAKAAVYVTVVDEETGNAIKKAGITFELYTDKDRRSRMKKLNTYYPEKIEYSKYETTDNGTFFLPEKIPMGTYSLHNLTVPESYGAGENVNFEIEEPYDWPEPFYLEVPLAPAKNIIRVLMKDSETNEPVQGYKYEVIADEDIITLDGTLRYTKDQIVDEFTLNEKGYGESEKLYLGNYRIRQKTAAEYYALDSTPVEVEVENNEDSDTPVINVTAEKTKYEVVLTDEYSGEAISGAVFAVEGRSDETTDEDGRFVLTDLTKATTYAVTLKSLPGKYQSNESDFKFRVDENGLIDDEAHSYTEHTAFVTRLIVSVKDILLKNDLNGENIAVYDDSGNAVANLDTGGTSETIVGLEAGDYTVESGGKESSRIAVKVENKAEPTKAYIYVWTYVDFAIIFVALLLIAAAVTTVVVIVKKKKVKKADAKRKAKG